MRVATSSALLSLLVGAMAQEVEYTPCPLLRAYLTPPKIYKTSQAIRAFSKSFTEEFDHLLANGSHPVYGPVTPSIVLSSANNDDPTFFEYHYTAPGAYASQPVSGDTRFPAGSLTQVLTVHAWLATLGDGHTSSPITRFIPGLSVINSNTTDFPIPWRDITIGALAGQLSGLQRESGACFVGEPCDGQEFLDTITSQSPLFLPDTTPVNSNLAYQLLAVALERATNATFSQILEEEIFDPSNMTSSGMLGDTRLTPFGGDIDLGMMGEPAALSLLTTSNDLSHYLSALLCSTTLPSPILRRWMQPQASTSNRANAVGRPREIFHAPISSSAKTLIIDALTKNGVGIPGYASHMGVVPDLGVGFGILAHDVEAQASGKVVDLNVHADILAEAIEALAATAAKQMAEDFAGSYSAENDTRAVLNVTDGFGVVVEELAMARADLLADTAERMGLKRTEDLDLRLYPSNLVAGAGADGGKARLKQFVAVYQDKTAPVDAGTPTCITWQGIGELGAEVVESVVFEVEKDGLATRMWAVTAPEVDLTKET